MGNWGATVDIVSMRTTTTPAAQTKRARRRTDLVVALGTVAYLLLAVGLGAALIITVAPDPRSPVLLPAVALAVAAYVAECASRRARDVLPKNVALAVYVAAALLLPVPWPVLIAGTAITACHLTRPGASTAARLTTTAHTIVVAALFTLLAHVVLGKVVPLHGLGPLVGAHPLWPATVAAPLGPGHVPSATALLSLALGAYLLDTLPLVAIGALRRRTGPRRAWRALYGRTLCAELAVPSLGILGALTCMVAWPAALLVVPFLVALYWGLEQAPVQGAGGDELQDAQPAPEPPARGAPPHPGADAQALLHAVLAAVRALGDSDELIQVTQTLAGAAARLTAFRDCTVYLYESQDGLFVPYAWSERSQKAEEAIPRGAAEGLMSDRHRRGYSYWARVARPPGAAEEAWRAGDVLLVPLLMKNGDVTGFISLDQPTDGQTPQADDLLPLETVAALGARVIARLRHTDEVLRLATTDGLTGLLNRRAFEERLQRELEVHGYRRPVALMMIDLDDFSSINNQHGHQIGDAALRLVADVIRAHLRHSDAGGRYGGDEFAVILPGLDAAGAVDVAERVRTALVEATARAAATGALPRINTSIGVASFPHDAAGPDALIKAADDALYVSKGLGKNRVSLRSIA
jgi:diguanylate cyclase (GGDEF)-like protein